MVLQAQQHINRLADDIAYLSESDLSVADYFAQVLPRLLGAFSAVAGAVWLRTSQGNLQLQCQINLAQIGWDRQEESRQSHDELLRQAVLRGQAHLLMPQTFLASTSGTGPGPGNPSEFVLFVVPILVEKQVAGLLEIWQTPEHTENALRGYLQFLQRMAGLMANYLRGQQLRQMASQQQIWTQLETYARQVHASLSPTEVAYVVANEGRRLIACDRLSVAVREGKRVRVEAVSGADVVERRSNLVRRMRALFTQVIFWGERLIYSGSRDDTLPPAVLTALDAYLAESNSKLLILLPLRDEREVDKGRPPRSALLLESFEPSSSAELFLARLEVIGRHAAPALYNAVEYRRIPLRWLWRPLAALQEGLGGKARALLTLLGLALGALLVALIVIPYPLKMDAKGQLLPRDRRWLYTPYPGHITGFAPDLQPGGRVTKGKEIVRLHSLELAKTLGQLQAEVARAKGEAESLRQLLNAEEKRADRAALLRQLHEAQTTYEAKVQELQELQRRTNADPQHPGDFWLRAPLEGIVLSADFREMLHRFIKEDEPILRIGYVHPQTPRIEDWEVELKIPQKHIGQVLAALGTQPDAELDVDLLLVSEPTRTYRGRLARQKIAPQANVDKTTHEESEPAVTAWVRLSGADIPPAAQLPPERLLSGTEVHARIRCGNYALGYSLFYGVWEFIYEKLVFPF